MVADLSMPERVIDQFRDLYVEELWDATDQWVHYRQVPDEASMLTTRAAREAARRMGITVHVDVAPAGYAGAPMTARRGHVVIRIADCPAPW